MCVLVNPSEPEHMLCICVSHAANTKCDCAVVAAVDQLRQRLLRRFHGVSATSDDVSARGVIMKSLPLYL